MGSGGSKNSINKYPHHQIKSVNNIPQTYVSDSENDLMRLVKTSQIDEMTERLIERILARHEFKKSYMIKLMKLCLNNKNKNCVDLNHVDLNHNDLNHIDSNLIGEKYDKDYLYNTLIQMIFCNKQSKLTIYDIIQSNASPEKNVIIESLCDSIPHIIANQLEISSLEIKDMPKIGECVMCFEQPDIIFDCHPEHMICLKCYIDWYLVKNNKNSDQNSVYTGKCTICSSVFHSVDLILITRQHK
jgi:hypothetical protein